ncbi:ATP-binding protein [Nonomuraea sp. NPDC003727]
MQVKIDYEAVFTAAPSLSAVLTPDFVITAVNDSLLRALDRTRAELIGQDVFAAFPMNPNILDDPGMQGAKALRASLEQVAATGQADVMSAQRYDIEEVGRPGVFEERYWSTVNTPILGPKDGVDWILLSSQEVTGFVKAMKRYGMRTAPGRDVEPDEVNADLYARACELHNLAGQLQETHDRQRATISALQEAVRRQRQAVFDTSHDLRNPITGLLTELEAALAEPHIDQRQMLRKLLRNTERLSEIVADVLDLARPDSGTTADMEVLDLGVFAADELERRAPAATVVTGLEREVLVRASRIRLARLLGNLLDNAERHASTTIEVHVTTAPPEAILEVVDDGPGIASADRERVFERLYRLDDARHRDPGGTGLGLAIAREIARAHGGQLHAADHPRGARFVLRLPLAAPPLRK